LRRTRRFSSADCANLGQRFSWLANRLILLDFTNNCKNASRKQESLLNTMTCDQSRDRKELPHVISCRSLTRVAKTHMQALVISSKRAPAAGNTDLMKKGLRPLISLDTSYRRDWAGNTDLMKKGLRLFPFHSPPSTLFNAGNTDLMKKGLRPDAGTFLIDHGRPMAGNTDLMKKGLRPFSLFSYI
jgi:hypothetical protein